MKNSKTKLFGFGIVQVLAGLAMAGALSLGVSQILVRMNEGGQRAKEQATLALIRNQSSAILANLPKWIEKMRISQPTLATCIPHTLTTYTCPAVTPPISDPEILALAAGDPIKSMPLVDVSASPLAGTEATPIRFDANGGLCPSTATNCVFQSVGYFKRKNLSGDPGDITFFYKISRIPSPTVTAPMKPIVATIAVGEAWKTPPVVIPGPTLPTCSTSEMLIGDGGGGFSCVPRPATLPACTATQMLVGKAGGGYECVTRPPAIPTCAAGKSLVANASGDFVCGEPYKCNTQNRTHSGPDDAYEEYCCTDPKEEIVFISAPEDKDFKTGIKNDRCGYASYVGSGNKIQLRCCK